MQNAFAAWRLRKSTTTVQEYREEARKQNTDDVEYWEPAASFTRPKFHAYDTLRNVMSTPLHQTREPKTVSVYEADNYLKR